MATKIPIEHTEHLNNTSIIWPENGDFFTIKNDTIRLKPLFHGY